METRKPCEKLKLNVTSGWELTAHHRSWKVSHNASMLPKRPLAYQPEDLQVSHG